MEIFSIRVVSQLFLIIYLIEHLEKITKNGQTITEDENFENASKSNWSNIQVFLNDQDLCPTTVLYILHYFIKLLRVNATTGTMFIPPVIQFIQKLDETISESVIYREDHDFRAKITKRLFTHGEMTFINVCAPTKVVLILAQDCAGLFYFVVTSGNKNCSVLLVLAAYFTIFHFEIFRNIMKQIIALAIIALSVIVYEKNISFQSPLISKRFWRKNEITPDISTYEKWYNLFEGTKMIQQSTIAIQLLFSINFINCCRMNGSNSNNYPLGYMMSALIFTLPMFTLSGEMQKDGWTSFAFSAYPLILLIFIFCQELFWLGRTMSRYITGSKRVISMRLISIGLRVCVFLTLSPVLIIIHSLKFISSLLYENVLTSQCVIIIYYMCKVVCKFQSDGLTSRLIFSPACDSLIETTLFAICLATTVSSISVMSTIYLGTDEDYDFSYFVTSFSLFSCITIYAYSENDYIQSKELAFITALISLLLTHRVCHYLYSSMLSGTLRSLQDQAKLTPWLIFYIMLILCYSFLCYFSNTSNYFTTILLIRSAYIGIATVLSEVMLISVIKNGGLWERCTLHMLFARGWLQCLTGIVLFFLHRFETDTSDHIIFIVFLHDMLSALTYMKSGLLDRLAHTSWSIFSSFNISHDLQESNDETDYECPICLIPMTEEVVETKCKHYFHWSCLCQWLRTVKNTCPLCRADILDLNVEVMESRYSFVVYMEIVLSSSIQLTTDLHNVSILNLNYLCAFLKIVEVSDPFDESENLMDLDDCLKDICYHGAAIIVSGLIWFLINIEPKLQFIVWGVAFSKTIDDFRPDE